MLTARPQFHGEHFDPPLTMGATHAIMKASKRKEVRQMSTEKEIIMFQKSTVYDLLQLIEKDPNKSYTVEELRELLAAYVKGLEQS